jgi:hypothetical protein
MPCWSVFATSHLCGRTEAGRPSIAISGDCLIAELEAISAQQSRGVRIRSKQLSDAANHGTVSFGNQLCKGRLNTENIGLFRE